MKYIITLTISVITSLSVFAQTPSTQGSISDLRKKEENAADSIVYAARHIHYTLIGLVKDSTTLLPLDTALTGFQNYSPIRQPNRPTIGLGGVGLACRDLLFNPSKTIGFDVGFHSLDRYLLKPDSIRYYRAQSPYTELYYVDGGNIEQIFKVTHAQNITPRWNAGLNYNAIGSDGLYINQGVTNSNAAFFSWFESKNKRYRILASAIFNSLKAGENGATIDAGGTDDSQKTMQAVRLTGIDDNAPYQKWNNKDFFLQQSFAFGPTNKSASGGKLPMQYVTLATRYSVNRYNFFRNELDINNAFPAISSLSTTLNTNDVTQFNNLKNELSYNFNLKHFLKNEFKITVGVQHDLGNYKQMGYEFNFNNITLKAGLGYDLNKRVAFDIDLQQIATGRNNGDFLYDAKAHLLLNNDAGHITLGAYFQNKSPEQLFNQVNYQFHQWDFNFSKTKINNYSLSYQNAKLKLTAKAAYFSISNYLYYEETALQNQLTPVQCTNKIDVFKLMLTKNFKMGNFSLDNYVVYQKSNYQDVLTTPELYTCNSLYYQNQLFKVLKMNIGFDLRFNTLYQAPEYAINVSQFYNSKTPVEYDSFPVIDFWVRATLKRVNLFLKYEYINQGMFQNVLYTVNPYPMQDRTLRFGLSWRFYN